MSTQRLDAVPLTTLSGVGAAISDKLSRIGIHNLQDLLFHLPIRYEDRTRITPIADLRPEQYATIEGVVQTCEVAFGRRPILTVSLSDGTSKIMLRFFNFNAGMKNSFQIGTRVKAFGEIKRGRFMAEIHHPEYQIIRDNAPLVLEETLTPIYSTTEGLKQNSLRKLTDQALALLDKIQLTEILPNEFNPHPFSLKDAIRFLHRPPPDISLDILEKGQHPAQQRLIFEELLAHNLAMQKVRLGTQQFLALPLHYQTDLKQRFLASLPFQPTNAQNRVVADIEQDLAKDYPMMRLVQGDVGSGKTLVAALAALLAIDNGKQVALMAPTEILAEQHANNFRRWLEPFGIEVGWLAGKVKGKARQAELEKIKSGAVQMVVGTHALFQEEVEFADLALVIIDEQHRFGVGQRRILREKGNNPDVLMMTATPIPRTLAITAFGDMDVSVIDQMPAGRKPIITRWVKHEQLNVVLNWLEKELQRGAQVYVISPLIEESEALDLKNAIALEEELKAYFGDKAQVALLHGKMKSEEKDTIMQDFKKGKIDILVSTTVIEVGVNVPNATVVLIMDADRFGLSQLHQLRGRVGRGDKQSYAVLVANPKTESGKKRMKIMTETTNGFVLAEEDLKMRGSGEIFGTRQSGIPEFQVADIVEDYPILEEARKVASQIVSISDWRTHADWHIVALHLDTQDYLD